MNWKLTHPGLFRTSLSKRLAQIWLLSDLKKSFSALKNSLAMHCVSLWLTLAASLQSVLYFLNKQFIAWAAIFTAVVAAFFYPAITNRLQFLSAMAAEVVFYFYRVASAIWTFHLISPLLPSFLSKVSFLLRLACPLPLLYNLLTSCASSRVSERRAFHD